MIVYISCYRKDIHWLRPCLASVRHFYPDVPIRLFKDESYGAFSTRELERHFGAEPFHPERRVGSWSLLKLELLMREERERYFVMDSDIVFTGPVLDLLGSSDADFVVDRTLSADDPRHSEINRVVYDYDGVMGFDPTFRYPGYVFNAGGMVATSGLLTRTDFEPLVDYTARIPHLKRPDIFRNADQGILNYLVAKAADAGRINADSNQFMIFSKQDEVEHIDLRLINSRSGPGRLVHWTGHKPPIFRDNRRGDLLEHYDRIYHSRLPAGAVIRSFRSSYRAAKWYCYPIARRGRMAIQWLGRN